MVAVVLNAEIKVEFKLKVLVTKECKKKQMREVKEIVIVEPV